MDGYGTRFIGDVFGIPVSRLHYWDETSVVKPSLRPAAGRGSKRLYSFIDLVALLVIERLRAMGISLQRVRRCLEFLRRRSPEIESPLAELSLITDGETIFQLTDDSDTLIDTLREQVVWSLPISHLVRSIRDTIASATARRTERVTVAGREFTVVMEQDPEDGCWVGLVQELPGCGSQGVTIEQLRGLVREAIADYLIAQRDLAGDGAEEAAASSVV